MQNNIPAVLGVMQFIYDNIMYAELNTKSDYCECCGFDGEIQIVEDEHGKLYITDHKSRALKPRSNRKKPTLGDIELDKYLRQLYIYASAVYQMYGRYPDYLEFNCFRTGTWICEPFKEERLDEVEVWATKLIDEITATNDWHANLDFWFCKQLCDVATECEYEEFL